MTSERIVLGWHWFIDLSHCQNLPTKVDELQSILVATATRAGATIVDQSFHKFSPYGLSGVVVIAESHLAAHTWPEHQAACVDLFSCTQKLNIDEAATFLADAFQANHFEVRCEERAIMHPNHTP